MFLNKRDGEIRGDDLNPKQIHLSKIISSPGHLTVLFQNLGKETECSKGTRISPS